VPELANMQIEPTILPTNMPALLGSGIISKREAENQLKSSAYCHPISTISISSGWDLPLFILEDGDAGF
jgi:hypothetical protein